MIYDCRESVEEETHRDLNSKADVAQVMLLPFSSIMARTLGKPQKSSSTSGPTTKAFFGTFFSQFKKRIVIP